jgi:hypothetical protein
VDESTATQIAAAQMIDSLGAPAGFMIALRLIQVIAERTSPKTPELIDAFAACLHGMERFAEVAGLDRMASADSAADGAASDGAGADSASAGGADGAARGAHVGNGRSNGSGGNGTPLA